jgi:hypothetical protein
MTVYLAPIANILQVLSDTGVPLSGGLLWTYLGGTVTPAVTYTDNTGIFANPNPIQMASNGRLPSQVWQPQGVAMRYVFSTNAGTTGAPVFGTQLGPTWDWVYGINDPTSLLSLLAAPASGASLIANAVIGYQAFSNLRVAGVPVLVSGQALLVALEGGDTIGDSKAGFFYWSPSATGADDDNNTIAPTGAGATGRYLRLPTAGLPTLVNALGSLAMVSGGLIYGTSATALAVLPPSADGSTFTLSGGQPVWSASSGGGGVGTSQVQTLASNTIVGSTRTAIFTSLPVVQGTYAMYAEVDATVAGGPSLTTLMTSDQSGSLTQVGTPIGWVMQESSGAYVGIRQNAAYPGITGQGLFNSITNYLLLRGRFTVPNGTTSVSFSMWCGGGTSPTINFLAGSYIQLLRLA